MLNLIKEGDVQAILKDVGLPEGIARSVTFAGYSVLQPPLPAADPYQELFDFDSIDQYYLWVVITVDGGYVTACLEDCCLPGDTVFVLLYSYVTHNYAFDKQTSQEGHTYYDPHGDPLACAYATLDVSPNWDIILIFFGYMEPHTHTFPASAWFTVSLQPSA